MRTIRDISILMAAVLICGCSKSDENVKLPETQLTITAGFAENDDTKTTLQDTGVYWEVGDEIKVFYGSGSGRFASVNTEETALTTFTGNINVAIGGNEGFTGGEYMWGLYPYRSDATYDGTAVTTTIPEQQTGKAGSFAKNMNISLAKSSNLALAFYNVCGGLRFSVTRDDITDVVFEGRNNEDLAGTIQVAFSEGVPVIQSLTGGKKKITLKAPNSETFESGKWYYIVAAPGTLPNGFKLTFNTTTQYAELVKTSSVTVKRGIFGSVEDADAGLTYQAKEIPAGNIEFKDSVAKYACVAKYDTDGDGEVSYMEAEAATSFVGLFNDWKGVTSFNEISYFKNVHSLDSVFCGCNKIVSITIPNNITDLGTSAFSGCSSLTSVVLPKEISEIGNYTFENCTKLSSIDIPSKVSAIGMYAFSDCSSLSFADLPSEVDTIDSYAFSGCSALEEIVIPHGVRFLGAGAFSKCSSLKTVNIPSGITSIPFRCFDGCSSLISMAIPYGVTSIESYAFKGVNMWKLKLPSSVTTIKNRCFSGITCVLVPSTSPVSIQSGSFIGVKGIFVPTDMVEIYKSMTNWSDYSSQLHPLSTYRAKNEFTLATSGAVDMGTSVKWAAYNVGATKPEEYGDHYAWGETETKSDYDWSTYFDSVDGSGSSFKKYYNGGGKIVLDSEDDVAHVKWGGTWRMPTEAECVELINNCYWEWTTYESINGQMMYGIGTGNKIFLPAVGYRISTYLNFVGSCGYYWSSSLGGPDSWLALTVNFVPKDVDMSTDDRYLGHSVRPVTE